MVKAVVGEYRASWLHRYDCEWKKEGGGDINLVTVTFPPTHTDTRITQWDLSNPVCANVFDAVSSW